MRLAAAALQAGEARSHAAMRRSRDCRSMGLGARARAAWSIRACSRFPLTGSNSASAAL